MAPPTQPRPRPRRPSVPVNSSAPTTRCSKRREKIKLSNRNELPLASWMELHHLPEHGVVSPRFHFHRSAAAPSSSQEEAPSERRTGEDQVAKHKIKPSAIAAPPVSASNNKMDKEIAIDSLNPPTEEEILGHIRYLCLAGMKLVTNEVDNCVRYCLRYSATRKKAVDEEGGEERPMTSESDPGVNQGKYWGSHYATLDSEVLAFIDLFLPVFDEGDDDGIAGVTSLKSNEIIQDGIMKGMVQERYDSTLLPIISIKCHPNVLDRTVITKILSMKLSMNDHRRHSAVEGKKSPTTCIISSSSSHVRQGHIMADVVSQCISNDPEGELFELQQKRRQRWQRSQIRNDVKGGVLLGSFWSHTRLLVEWAGFTEAFDSIIVILEDPEKVPSPVLDSFFSSMVYLRSDHGVPISIVIVDVTPGGLGNRLSALRDPSLRGAVVRELNVPSPKIQLELFVNKIFAGRCIPPLWTNKSLMKRIQKLFLGCDNSIVTVSKLLKSDLRRYMSLPGAFVTLLNHEEYVLPNESRLKWLLGDEFCKRKILSRSNYHAKDRHILDLSLNVQTSYLCNQICQKINLIFNVSPFETIGQVISSKFFSSFGMRQVLSLLDRARNKLFSWKVDGYSTPVQNKLDEFIILVGEFAPDQEPHASLTRALVEAIVTWTTGQFTMQLISTDAPTIQPRRDVANPLSLQASNAFARCPLAHARRIAFQAFQSRVITLAEWHETYFDLIADQDGDDTGVSSIEAAFFVAVYELIHCGFVQMLATGRRRQDAYEKLALVWASGR